MSETLSVAVIGAGMAGRAHAAGYRMAPAVFGAGLPDVRLVAIADVHEPSAADAARRFGYERAEAGWQAIVDADDIDVVSVVVANPLHREIVEALAAAGKHVLCEKPVAPTVNDAEAMATAIRDAGVLGGVGFTFRRMPALAAIRRLLDGGQLGRPLHLDGHYWCDYGVDPNRPIGWRYQGPPGSGVLADVGSHLVDVSEWLCGRVVAARGGTFSTLIHDRPVPLGHAVGHAAAEVRDERELVENEDVATFTLVFERGATASLVVSRVHHGHPNSLGLQLGASDGAARFEASRMGEFELVDGRPEAEGTNGFRTVLVGPDHPNISGGMAMDFPGVNHGQNDLFTWQARAFLEQVADVDGLTPLPTFEHGVHNLRILDAIAESAARNGAEVPVP